jgi:hypothetical protein
MTLFHTKKRVSFRESRGKDLSWDIVLKVKNLIKEDRILDDTAPGIVSKYTVDFE